MFVRQWYLKCTIGQIERWWQREIPFGRFMNGSSCLKSSLTYELSKRECELYHVRFAMSAVGAYSRALTFQPASINHHSSSSPLADHMRQFSIMRGQSNSNCGCEISIGTPTNRCFLYITKFDQKIAP